MRGRLKGTFLLVGLTFAAATIRALGACGGFDGSEPAADAGGPPLDAGTDTPPITPPITPSVDAATDAGQILPNRTDLHPCDGGQVDLSNDARNCGACGNTCEVGRFCDLQKCVLMPGLQACPGSRPCELHDPRSCNGVACADFQRCDQDRKCVDRDGGPTSCTSNRPPCPQQAPGKTGVEGCYEGNTVLNCGACGKACTAGQACIASECSAFAPSQRCTDICGAGCCNSGSVCCSPPQNAQTNQVLCVKGDTCPSW